MNPLKRFAKNISELDQTDILRTVFLLPEVQDLIVALNTQGQLFDLGVNAEGIPLKTIGGDYSESYKKTKARLLLPTDRVTLRLTGDYYDTFHVEVGKDFILILSNPLKNGVDLFERWGRDVEGLTDDSIETLIETLLLNEFIKETERRMFVGIT